MSDDQFAAALEKVDAAQQEYGQQIGLRDGRTPFASESLPSAQVSVRVNQDLLKEVASHFINRSGHVSITDEPGSGKSHFRDLVYDSLQSGGASDDFAVARIREIADITTRRLYVRVLDELQEADAVDVPDTYPHATDDVLSVLEDVSDQLEAEGMCCIVQIDQLEDVASNTRTFRELLSGLQAIGDLGDGEPTFLLFLFGTPRASERLEELRETLATRFIAKDRELERFTYPETAELVGRWLSWARGEEYDDGYPIDPFTSGAVEAIVERSDGTPRSTRQECFHAFRAGVEQYADGDGVEITAETIRTYA
ncbi:hypothetical protein C475_08867 [Halosimplex carlsbadense 2-9-1]|uniref:Orc1/cdc6 family replication initiation protein n=1 Tax=Halosimplex carlsbadense 2-9-1 TaxID=797114 RepID=M0CTG4_9EURY|nr:hypothetical protein [Halosimplex carlsbadense]ELZ26525.1 hypothetical protein C475_08867 [Halosimplex carlsbadense 2-9-1]